MSQNVRIKFSYHHTFFDAYNFYKTVFWYKTPDLEGLWIFNTSILYMRRSTTVDHTITPQTVVYFLIDTRRCWYNNIGHDMIITINRVWSCHNFTCSWSRNRVEIVNASKLKNENACDRLWSTTKVQMPFNDRSRRPETVPRISKNIKNNIRTIIIRIFEDHLVYPGKNGCIELAC